MIEGTEMNTGADRADPTSRIQTGNAQADEILEGGFPRNSINIVMGQPGTGKTIFVEQLLFHNAGGGRPSFYVTTLSEPLTKVVNYVQRFRFFKADLLGEDIQYEDLGHELAERGPDALIDWLRETIRTRSPKIVVIDSFRALHDLALSNEDTRRFVSRIAGIFSAYEVTAFLIGEYTHDDISRYPEFAVADSILELARQQLTTRDERYLRVLKLRGSTYREGQHAFRITDDGLNLYPRLVAPRVPEEYEALTERLSTGVPGLDQLMGGGLIAGSTTLAAGMAGSGKTTMALQFALAGVSIGERVMYVHFQENPVQLRRAIGSLGIDPVDAQKAGLQLHYASPVELQIDSIVIEIFEAIKTGSVRRVVIDAVGDLAAAANDPQRVHNYLYSLVQHFAVRGVTSVLTLEAYEGFPGSRSDFNRRFSYMSDNLLHLAWSSEVSGQRTIRVVKMRGSSHEHGIRKVDIDEHGLRVT
jgi:circadian clock protein KaiC